MGSNPVKGSLPAWHESLHTGMQTCRFPGFSSYVVASGVLSTPLGRGRTRRLHRIAAAKSLPPNQIARSREQARLAAVQRRESLAVGNLGAPSRSCDSWSPGLGYGVAALRGGGTTAAGWDDRGLLPLPTCTYHLPYSLVPCLAAAASRTRRSGRERVGDPGGRLRRMPIRRVRCLHVPYQLRGGKLNSQQSEGSLIWAWRTRPVRPTAPLAWPRHNHPVLEPRVSRRTAGAMPAVNAQGTGQEGV